MSWISKLFTGGENPIASAGNALDKLFTSDHERLQARAVLEELQNKFELALQETMTERHKADMASDSWLSKNIRPGMWLGTGALLVAAYAADTVMRQFGAPGITDKVMEGAWWAFATVSSLYVPARMVDKGLVNWKKL